jgi:hypothetical protein
MKPGEWVAMAPGYPYYQKFDIGRVEEIIKQDGRLGMVRGYLRNLDRFVLLRIYLEDTVAAEPEEDDLAAFMLRELQR